MSVIKFACPECGKNLGIDSANAAPKLKCPACKKIIPNPNTVPEAIAVPTQDEMSGNELQQPSGAQGRPVPSTIHQRRHIRGPRSNTTTYVVVGGIALLILVVGALFAKGVFSGSSHGWSPLGGLTRSCDDIESKLRSSNGGYYKDNGDEIMWKSTDIEKMIGKPDSISRVGESTYWNYNCSDGKIQLVFYGDDGVGFFLERVNRYGR